MWRKRVFNAIFICIGRHNYNSFAKESVLRHISLLYGKLTSVNATSIFNFFMVGTLSTKKLISQAISPCIFPIGLKQSQCAPWDCEFEIKLDPEILDLSSLARYWPLYWLTNESNASLLQLNKANIFIWNWIGHNWNSEYELLNYSKTVWCLFIF